VRRGPNLKSVGRKGAQGGKMKEENVRYVNLDYARGKKGGTFF